MGKDDQIAQHVKLHERGRSGEYQQAGMILQGFTSPRFLKIMGACSFAAWLASMGVFFQLAGSRPETPNPALGQIYELSNKSHVVYISFRDGLLFYGLMFGGLAGGITTITIGRRLQESRRSSPARYR